MSEPVYVIGIDLGTTNSVVSYTPIDRPDGNPPEIRVLEIPQTVSPGVIESHQTLPSFLLSPGPHDVSDGALDLPWEKVTDFTIGAYAKNRGAEIPQRLIASSKSWLCHGMVDRNEQILPWESPPDCPKLSPVEASAGILRHIRKAWNHTMAGADGEYDPRLLLENQDIYVTVPASFDAVARELTVRAAQLAGIEHITLLEEPTAAFYSWIHDTNDRWREMVHEGDRILVCDIGGGTSDFSLIEVKSSDGALSLERVAVGNHLLVGGDNMDLTLAYLLSQKLSGEGTRLSTPQFQALSHSCRIAKEDLFSNDDKDNAAITILGSGGRLIGGSIRTDLIRKEMEGVILDGFFPLCDVNAGPRQNTGSGLRELGLSYESDPAVTHHLAEFVRSLPSVDEAPSPPTSVLFNGGVMKAKSLRDRVCRVMNSWCSDAGRSEVREIAGMDFDLAVAKGAAYYGLANRGEGIRIRSGLNRSYYLGIAAAMPAVPGIPAPMKALCVAPFGMEEGTTAAVPDREFVLVVGEPVGFDFLGATSRHDDQVGDVIESWGEEILQVAKIETTLSGDSGAVIPVTMEIRTTEVGTLEVWCVSKDSNQRWKLEFNVREGNR